MIYTIVIYLIVINIMAFLAYGIDKQRAKRDVWRIPEAILLLLAFLGGALGAFVGMRVFRHKTKHRKFRFLVPLLLVLWIVITAIFGAATYMLDYSLNPDGKAERDADSFVFLKEKYPGTVEWMDSLRLAGTLRDTVIINDKGLKLHAFFASNPNPNGNAILVHGYTDNALRMMQLGRLYYDSLHFNILLPDHVRHGKSDGNAIQMGWLDRLNIERWIVVADNLWPGQPTYLHGVSMGAATVMMCSGDKLPPSVKGIIEDCGYTSVWDQFSKEIRGQFHLPVHPLLDVASWLCQLQYGWNFHEASAIEQVRKSTLPMLFIHGDCDDFVPTSMVYPLYEAKTKGYKQLWIAHGSAHAEAYKDHPQEYFDEMKTFLKNANASD